MRLRLGSLTMLMAFGSACSMQSIPVTPSRAGDTAAYTLPAPGQTQHLLYVASGPLGPGGVISIFSVEGSKSKLLATLTKKINGPSAPCLSADGTLYVPNEEDATIAVFPFGHSTPSRVLAAETGGTPIGCAVDASNNLWVADFANQKVYEFVDGKNQIGASVNVSCPASVAFDPSGNMYVGDFGFNLFGKCKPAAIFAFAPGQSSPFETITNGLHGILSAIAFGPDGNLYAANFTNADIVVFPPGKTRYSKKITSKTFGVFALAVAEDGRLYASRAVRAHGKNHYSVVVFARGAESRGRKLIANPERRSDGLHYISGLAAWPVVVP